MAKKSATVATLVRTYLAEQCTVLIDAEAQLRSREPVIHSTRVAARLLRSTLRTYAETTDVDRAAALSAELVWFAGLLGEVRDREVLEQRLLADLAELPAELVVGPVAAQIETELTTGRKAAWDAVLDALDTDRYRQLQVDLHRWRSDPPLTKDADDPAATVSRYAKRHQEARQATGPCHRSPPQRPGRRSPPASGSQGRQAGSLRRPARRASAR